MIYNNTVGPIRLEVQGWRDGGNAVLRLPDRWSSNDIVDITIKREQLHDLRYLIDRALAAIEEVEK